MEFRLRIEGDVPVIRGDTNRIKQALPAPAPGCHPCKRGDTPAHQPHQAGASPRPPCEGATRLYRLRQAGFRQGTSGAGGRDLRGAGGRDLRGAGGRDLRAEGKVEASTRRPSFGETFAHQTLHRILQLPVKRGSRSCTARLPEKRGSAMPRNTRPSYTMSTPEKAGSAMPRETVKYGDASRRSEIQRCLAEQ